MLPTLQRGDRVAGTSLVITGRVGKGGMGTVYAAHDTLLDIDRAVKFIDVDVEEGPKRDAAIAEVLKEARVLAKLHRECPEHIVEVLAMGVTADSRRIPYLVMELVRGATLLEFLKKQGGRLVAKDVRQLALETLAALVTVHEHAIVHRDLKPANIMIEPIPGTDDGTRMKLIDFGITSEVGRRTMRRALTFKYGAPEQIHIEGEHRLTGQTDLYTLGVILFEAIAGRGPFDDICLTGDQFVFAHLKTPAPSIASVVPGIPREHAQLIDSMLEKDPRKRPESARVLGAKFSALRWDFATSVPEDSQKTHENMNTVLASVVRAAVEKNEKPREPKAEPPPQAAPPDVPKVSTTLPSPGVLPDARPVVVRDRPRGSTVRMDPSSPLPSAPHGFRSTPTATSPPVPAVREREGGRAGPNSNPHVVSGRFFVNNTAPLDPELDTRGRKRSIFDASWLRSRPPAVRAIVAVALASMCALVVVEVGVLFQRRHSLPTPAPVAPTPVASVVMTSLPVVTTATATPSATAIVAPVVAAISAQPTAVPVTPAPTPTQAPVAVKPKPSSRPTASSSAHADSGDIMIDLGDGVKVPMNGHRLPGSGL